MLLRFIDIKLVLIAITTAVFGYPQLSYAEDTKGYEWVSIISLIATPERYHKKRVVVTGWLTLEFENMSLCLSQEVSSSKECIWVEATESNNENSVHKSRTHDWEAYNGKTVFIRGTFDQEDTGHLGGWSGGIGEITQVTPVKRSRLPEK